MKQVIAVIDIAVNAALSSELTQWHLDLNVEGWDDRAIRTSAGDSYLKVKERIHALIDPSATEVAIILIGHVPAPPCYLGQRPDGHGAYGVAPSDWWYACDYDWPTTTINGREVLDVSRTGGIVPRRPAYQIGRIDFRGLQFDALGENDSVWEMDRLQAYFDKLHRYRTGQFVPAQRGLAAEAGEYVGGYVSDTIRNFYMPPRSYIPAYIAQVDEWEATAGKPPANPYRVAMYSPHCLNGKVKLIDATMVQAWRSFHWQQGNNKHLPAWSSNSPWTRNFIARNPNTLCAWWSGMRMDVDVLHNGTVGNAVRKANALQAACCVQGDVTLRLFPRG